MTQAATAIKLVVLDIDGVLTDGSIIYSANGDELKIFNAKDGFAIKHIGPENGLEFAIITGSSCPSVLKRAHFLNIRHIYTDSFEKSAAFRRLQEELKLENSEIAYMGDDWFDWPAMVQAGFKGAPADAADEILSRADFIANNRGGQGAVREFVEAILKRNGTYQSALVRYFNAE